MILRSLFIIGALVLLSSCGAGGAKFSGLEQPAKDVAQVYIYRPSAFVQSGNFPDVALDGKEIGQLKNGGYLRLTAPSGEHNLSLTGNYMQWIHKDAQFPIHFETGKTNFYKLTVSMSGSRGSGINVGSGQNHSFGFQHIVDEKEALADLSELNESK